MSNISVTTQQSVIDVTNTSGITVTTPEGQVIDVTVPNSTVAVTNTTDEITILTAGTLNINSSGVVTSVNGDTGPIVILDTDDVGEGSTNLYYTATRFNTAFAGKSTSDLTEGTNLYYTPARFDTRLATKTTDNLNEGITNQYFTDARARTAVSVSDVGGDGSLSYNNSTGVITYTGPSASEVRAHFTAGTGISITAGEISVTGIEPLITLSTTTTTADQVLDSFAVTAYRTAKYVISISSGSEYHSTELLLNHDGTTANQTTYADLPTGASLATFSVDISGGVVRLLTTPTNAVTVYKVTRTAIAV